MTVTQYQRAFFSAAALAGVYQDNSADTLLFDLYTKSDRQYLTDEFKNALAPYFPEYVMELADSIYWGIFKNAFLDLFCVGPDKSIVLTSKLKEKGFF